MNILKGTDKLGRIYYYNEDTGKRASKRDYIRTAGPLEYEQLLESGRLTRADKISRAASQRLRIDGKFINKRKEAFFRDIAKDRNISLEGNELTRILDRETINKIVKSREKVSEFITKYSKGWDKKEKKRTQVFDIFKEIAASKKAGRKFQINGQDVTPGEAIKKVSEFINEKIEGLENPPLFIWRLIFKGDGDILDIDLEETEVISSD